MLMANLAAQVCVKDLVANLKAASVFGRLVQGIHGCQDFSRSIDTVCMTFDDSWVGLSIAVPSFSELDISNTSSTFELSNFPPRYVFRRPHLCGCLPTLDGSLVIA